MITQNSISWFVTLHHSWAESGYRNFQTNYELYKKQQFRINSQTTCSDWPRERTTSWAEPTYEHVLQCLEYFSQNHLHCEDANYNAYSCVKKSAGNPGDLGSWQSLWHNIIFSNSGQVVTYRWDNLIPKKLQYWFHTVYQLSLDNTHGMQKKDTVQLPASASPTRRAGKHSQASYTMLSGRQKFCLW